MQPSYPSATRCESELSTIALRAASDSLLNGDTFCPSRVFRNFVNRPSIAFRSAALRLGRAFSRAAATSCTLQQPLRSVHPDNAGLQLEWTCERQAPVATAERLHFPHNTTVCSSKAGTPIRIGTWAGAHTKHAPEPQCSTRISFQTSQAKKRNVHQSLDVHLFNTGLPHMQPSVKPSQLLGNSAGLPAGGLLLAVTCGGSSLSFQAQQPDRLG